MMYLGLDTGKRWHDAALLDPMARPSGNCWQLCFASTRVGLTQLAARLARSRRRMCTSAWTPPACIDSPSMRGSCSGVRLTFAC